MCIHWNQESVSHSFSEMLHMGSSFHIRLLCTLHLIHLWMPLNQSMLRYFRIEKIVVGGKVMQKTDLKFSLKPVLQNRVSLMYLLLAMCYPSHSFELVWPGHCLTVTPQNGVLQPNDQRVLLVSANPSIHSKGVNLPWRGSVYVSCDNLEKVILCQSMT